MAGPADEHPWRHEIKFDHFVRVLTVEVSGPEAEAQDRAARSKESDFKLSILESGLFMTLKEHYDTAHEITFGAMPRHTVQFLEDGIQVLTQDFAVIEREAWESGWTLRVVSRQANVFLNDEPVKRNINLVSGDRLRMLNNEFLLHFRTAGGQDFPDCFHDGAVVPEKPDAGDVGGKRKRDGAAAS